MDNDQTIIQIHAFLTGQMSDQERMVFEAWLDESVDNQAQYEQYKEAWDLSANYSLPRFDSGQARVSMPFVAEKSNPRVRGMSTKRWSIAASVLVLIAAGLWVLSGLKSESHLASGTSTPVLELEDGSIVYLRPDALVEFPDDFSSDERVVELERGEAYFDIARDEARKFVVETRFADITVLGTEFDVDVNEYVLEVHVTEGKVRVDPEETDLFLELTEGQSAYFDSRTGELKRVRSADMNEVAWHTRRLNFRNAKMTDVIRVLGETFDISITIEDSELEGCSVTSTYTNKTLSGVLNDLSQIYGCKVIQESSGTYTLRGGSCD